MQHSSFYKLTTPPPPPLPFRASLGPAMDIWTQPNQQWNNQDITYPDRIHHPNQDNYSMWTEPKKIMWLSKTSYINGSSQALHFTSAGDTAYSLLPLPSCPFHNLSMLTESLKGLSPPNLSTSGSTGCLLDVLRSSQAFRLLSLDSGLSYSCVQSSHGLKMERAERRGWTDKKM